MASSEFFYERANLDVSRLRQRYFRPMMQGGFGRVKEHWYQWVLLQHVSILLSNLGVSQILQVYEEGPVSCLLHTLSTISEAVSQLGLQSVSQEKEEGDTRRSNMSAS